MAREMENRTCKVREQMNRLARQPETMNIASSAVLKGLYEDLHWLVSMAGYVVCMECDGKEPLMPADLMTYSMEQAYQDQVNVHAQSGIELQHRLILEQMGVELFGARRGQLLGDKHDSPRSLRFTEVFLYSLNIVMPLMTMDLLKFPSLCRQYFKMIILICEIHPTKVCELPGELLQKLLASVKLGLFSFGRDVTGFCCNIIHAMARHIYSESKRGGPTNQFMSPFLNLFMNLILSQQFNADVVSNTCVPLYTLICCYQEQYKQIVQSFLAAQSNPHIAQRLAAAFTELAENVEFNNVQRLKFRSNFDKFILNVQGFLLVQ